MTNEEMLQNLTEVKNILSNTLKSKEVEKLMKDNKSYCINSIFTKQLNAKEIALDLLETLNY